MSSAMRASAAAVLDELADKRGKSQRWSSLIIGSQRAATDLRVCSV
jgi:hypothetical protein